MVEEKFLFDEGVKEIMMSLLSMGALAYEADYVEKQLSKRPEPIEQKIEALSKAVKISPKLSFDQAMEKMMAYYKGSHVDNPASHDKSSDNKLLEFIKSHEKFSPTPYKDYKQISIGYGTKALPNETSITEEEAEKRLIKTMKLHRDAVIREGNHWGYNWNNNQIDALTSFRYNVGNLKRLTQNGSRSNDEISKMILRYDKAGGESLPGLTARRKAEQLMFLKGINDDV